MHLKGEIKMNLMNTIMNIYVIIIQKWLVYIII